MKCSHTKQYEIMKSIEFGSSLPITEMCTHDNNVECNLCRLANRQRSDANRTLQRHATYVGHSIGPWRKAVRPHNLMATGCYSPVLAIACIYNRMLRSMYSVGLLTREPS